MKSNPYQDIIHLERPKSKHKPMPLNKRAAQFAPFAALQGYDESIQESHRLTTTKHILSIDEEEELNQVLAHIVDTLPTHPPICITYFVKDEKKEGGTYIYYEGQVKKIDLIEGWIKVDTRKILLENVLLIEMAE